MRVALIVLGCLVVLTAILLSVRTGILFEYTEDGVLVQARVAFLRFPVVPAPKKRGKPTKTKKKPAAKSKKQRSAGEPPKRGGALSDLLSLLPMVLEALGTLCRRIRVEHLRAHYTIAGQPDPAKAALQYGAVSVGGGAVCRLLERYLTVLERDVSAEVDFCSETSAVYLSAACSLRVGQAAAAALKLFWQYWTWKKRRDHAAQEENTYG